MSACSRTKEYRNVEKMQAEFLIHRHRKEYD